MQQDFEIIVVGAGIAGASVAAHLSETHNVAILEMEERPGYHTTGRSAAAFEPNYGPPSIRALTRAARRFFENPPQAFGALPLVTPRATIFLMPPGQESAAQQFLAGSHGLREISFSKAKKRHPLLRDGYAPTGVLDEGTSDIDVDLLHQGYLRLFKSHGGVLICNAAAERIERNTGAWRVETRQGTFRAPLLVNAAGAWGDEVAKLAGLKPVGLQPRRRSMAVIPGPADQDFMAWPLVGDVGETWYCKPQSGRLLVSPADATPVDPHDAYADDMTLAEGIARFQEAVDLEVTRVDSTWGGLRTFAPDGNPVCGFAPSTEGFFWLVGQGGYGIQTSPALSRVAAALVRRDDVDKDILSEGLLLADIAPSRLRK